MSLMLLARELALLAALRAIQILLRLIGRELGLSEAERRALVERMVAVLEPERSDGN